MLPLSVRKWLAFGAGVGIEIGPRDLTVAVVRVRPSGSTVLGTQVIESFRARPAAEWGKQYSDFLKEYRVGHIAAVVLMPRPEIILRTMPFPGVKDEELGAAVNFQLDSLHPYGEDDAVLAWARLDPVNVLLGVQRKQLFESYQTLFSEAGVKVASFTFSAAAIRSAIRMVNDPPRNFVAFLPTAAGLEVYGESEAKPVFSAVFDLALERAIPMAAAELRIDAATEPVELGIGLSQAAAMASACPNLSLPANLLPEDQRRATSKLRYVPTVVLGLAFAGLMTAIFLHKPYDEQKYREALEAELKRVEPLAARVANLDKNIGKSKARVTQLDDFRRRTRADLDLILEMTSTFQPPAFLNGMDVTRDTLSVAGEIDQAAPLLRVLDSSPRLAGSEFTIPIARMATTEAFRIRSQRETPPAAAPPPPPTVGNQPMPPPPVTLGAPKP